MADDLVSSLRQRDFPDCCSQAVRSLGVLVAQACNVNRDQASIPGLGRPGDDVVSQEMASHVADEFIFCTKNARGKPQKRLSAIQELQLLEILFSFLEQEANSMVCQTVFRLLFGVEGAVEGSSLKKDVLCKLVSMAVGTQGRQVLECVAVWAQMEGCGSAVVAMVMQTLVQDYCEQQGGEQGSSKSPLQYLPNLSANFTCIFVTAVTSMYQPPGSKSGRPTLSHSLLALLTEWIEKDPRLCLLTLSSPELQPHKAYLWTSPTKPNTHTPIPSLLRWCTKAPCVPPQHEGNEERWGESWSRLHLGLLQTILCFPSLHGANQLELVTLADMNRILKDTVATSKTAPGERAEQAINRLVQVLQVSLTTGAFRCSLGDLRNICKTIPPNRLLTLVSSQHLSAAPPQMHNAS